MYMILLSSIATMCVGVGVVAHILLYSQSPLKQIVNDKCCFDICLRECMFGLLLGCIMIGSGILGILSGIATLWMLAVIPLAAWFSVMLHFDFKRFEEKHEHEKNS